MRVFTIGHGARPVAELLECLSQAEVRTLVDIRRFPASRRNPQFDAPALADSLGAAGVPYRHAEELGGRRSREPGEERFSCVTVAAFRSYAARMTTQQWQTALADALDAEDPCLMCAETPWWRCHRRLVAELLAARGHEVFHILSPGRVERHRQWEIADYREGRLYLCGSAVA